MIVTFKTNAFEVNKLEKFQYNNIKVRKRNLVKMSQQEENRHVDLQ